MYDKSFCRITRSRIISLADGSLSTKMKVKVEDMPWNRQQCGRLCSRQQIHPGKQYISHQRGPSQGSSCCSEYCVPNCYYLEG
jgi:hypothetical protein